jgi:sulfite exporter TauE/SafE
MSLDLFSAFIIGLLGSGHCLAMCGGITTMLTSAINKPNTIAMEGNSSLGDISINVSTTNSSQTNSNCSPNLNRFNLVILYHVGRIGSYCLIGAIVGLTGSIAAKNIGVPIAGLRLFAAIFLIFLGLYIGQWLLWLNRVEALGKGLWARLSPLTKHVIPVDNHKKALGLGALWGWLPCGLVYSTLTWALASGNSLTGASIMLFFGLGTLPALLTVSLGIVSIKNLLVNKVFRKIMAISLVCYGIYSFVVAYQLMF